ncbi:DUF1365 domain-containing protein [Pseudonocardia xishanensis]|uniref:DUF1365 domain-containing protein n=1 Tax=Pseudonocardia xishanensis TaxID=630995 RepID=UPI0031E7AB9E
MTVRGESRQSTTSRAQLFDAEVRHRRREALDYGFAHRTYLWLVDLDALPRWAGVFGRFAARDHLGDPDRSIRENVDAYLATQGVDLRGGRILMLANARVAGYVFNPLSVFWCHRDTGELACVVAEVHNTYGERHCYLLRSERAELEKDFYVSPFFTVDGGYRMSLPEPTDRLALAIALERGGTTAFTATLTGTRREATPRALAGMLLRRPFVTQRTSALIRLHGIRLWLRRLPVVPRPQHHPQEGV